MKSETMRAHFHKIYEQRNTMKDILDLYKGKEWHRIHDDKWSLGETYYHLYLLIKWFRRLNIFYLPISKIFLKNSNQIYLKNSHDIYSQYRKTHKKPMKAPFILIPPKNIERKISFNQLLLELNNETLLFEKMVAVYEENQAGQIKFPDPIAHYPNLIQSVDLIGIHENHHFQLYRTYA
ncbi:hypothetical protein [Alkalihalobacillus trypoxylicola]|nr:hypothetical protein [Alkalihalobacillus trypoxylicola]